LRAPVRVDDVTSTTFPDMDALVWTFAAPLVIVQDTIDIALLDMTPLIEIALVEGLIIVDDDARIVTDVIVPAPNRKAALDEDDVVSVVVIIEIDDDVSAEENETPATETAMRLPDTLTTEDAASAANVIP
jgi:hypothetical protein